jgi:hypothetical protein
LADRPYVYTVHLLNQIAERKIHRSWVESVVENPDRIEPDPKFSHRWRFYRRIADFGARVLCVICDDRDGRLELVTAFFDRKKQV